MANRKGEVLVGLGTAAVLVPLITLSLVLGRHASAPEHKAATATPSALALATDMPVSLPPLPPAVASLVPSPSAPLVVPRTPAPTRALAPPPPPPFSGSWPDYRSGPEQTGWNGAENQLDASGVRRLSTRWTASGLSVPPVIGYNNLYLANLQEVDVMPAGGCGASSCGYTWRADLGLSPQGPGTLAGAPALADSGLFVTVNFNGNAWLYAYHAGGCGARTCEPWWRHQVGFNTQSGGNSNGYASSGPMAADGMVFTAPANPGTLYAFAAGGCGAPDCAPVWTAPLAQGMGSITPTVAGGILYVMNGDYLTAFTASGCGASTCAPLWSADLGLPAGGAFAVSNGRVFVDDSSGNLRAFDAQSGAALWKVSTGSTYFVHSSPMVVPGVVVAAVSNSLSVFDPATGALLWAVPVGASVTSASPTGGDGVGYVLGNDNHLYAFATTPCGASSCAPFWSQSLGMSGSAGAGGWDGPIVAGGRLFARDNGGLLHCMEVS